MIMSASGTALRVRKKAPDISRLETVQNGAEEEMERNGQDHYAWAHAGGLDEPKQLTDQSPLKRGGRAAANEKVENPVKAGAPLLRATKAHTTLSADGLDH